MQDLIKLISKLSNKLFHTSNPTQTRIDLDSYFAKIAVLTSARSTCPRLSVGAVIVLDGKIVSTGFNGAPRHTRHCTEVGCYIVDGSCKRAAHAEINAITFAKTDLEGATIYVTNEPCLACSISIINAQISRVVYGLPYKNALSLSRQLFLEAGVKIERLQV